MNTTRRVFLKSGGLALVSVGLAPGWGPRFLRDTVFADEPARSPRATGGRKTLVCIFQRGAVDGMSMVVPHGDPYYYQHRAVGGAGIAIANTGPNAVIDLDGTFGLHPALAALKPIYDAGHFAAIQACGSPSTSRSHFDAQDFMESGTPDRVMADGWLSRALANCPEDAARRAARSAALHGQADSPADMEDVFRAVSMTGQVPLSLRGSDALALTNLSAFSVGGGAGLAHGVPRGIDAASGFEAMYDSAVGDALHGTGKESFEAMKLLQSLSSKPYVPEHGAVYPRNNFGLALQQIAQLIKAGVGLEVAFAQTDGWDTHVQQGAANGRLSNNLRDFGNGLAAFYSDMGDGMSDVVVLTMSEFGRTARQNGTGGTDHGHATCFFALGGSVNGGKVLGQWPGLAPEQLYEGRDLAVTTDFRDVFGEVAMRHLGVQNPAVVFPGRDANQMQVRNIIRRA